MKLLALKRGRRVRDFAEALVLIEAGRWLFRNNKPHHPAQVAQWPVIQLSEAIRRGFIFKAKEVK